MFCLSNQLNLSQGGKTAPSYFLLWFCLMSIVGRVIPLTIMFHRPENVSIANYSSIKGFFGECDAPAIGHGQSSLLQSLAISLPQMIPRFERYLRFRSPANSLEEAFWGRNVACDES